MKRMKRIVILCGGRDWEMTTEAGQWLYGRLQMFNPWAILHGDARGADRQAATIAAKSFDEVFAFPADWDKHGKSAGPIRNQEMLTWALRTGFEIVVLAFPGGVGTGHMCKIAERAGAVVEDYASWRTDPIFPQPPKENGTSNVGAPSGGTTDQATQSVPEGRDQSGEA